ncbi:MAG: hypothetical protein R3D55_16685 [Chloroflexota bacterium]
MLDLTESFKTFPVLETARLRLRAMVPQDAEAVFALLGDPEDGLARPSSLCHP